MAGSRGAVASRAALIPSRGSGGERAWQGSRRPRAREPDVGTAQRAGARAPRDATPPSPARPHPAPRRGRSRGAKVAGVRKKTPFFQPRSLYLWHHERSRGRPAARGRSRPAAAVAARVGPRARPASQRDAKRSIHCSAAAGSLRPSGA